MELPASSMVRLREEESSCRAKRRISAVRAVDLGEEEVKVHRDSRGGEKMQSVGGRDCQ